MAVAAAWQGHAAQATHTNSGGVPLAHIDQISIDMGPPGTSVGVTANGQQAIGDRDGDGIPDAEGAPDSGGAAATSPGACGNGIDDDAVDIGTGNPDGVADDGCQVPLSDLEFCAEIIDDDNLNADEDFVDTLSVDITVGPHPGNSFGIPGGIPPDSGLNGAMSAWQYEIYWEPDLGAVVSPQQTEFLIYSNGAAFPVTNASAQLPDTTSPWTPALSTAGPADDGSGVLNRIRFEGDRAGVGTLTLNSDSIMDKNNITYTVDSYNNAYVAVSSDGPDGGTVIGDSPGEENHCPAQIALSVDSVVTTVSPTATLDISFPVTADVSLNNGGPVDVAVDTSIKINLPSDCTTADPNPKLDTDNVIAASGSPVALTQRSWNVICAVPSNHSFTATANATVDESGFIGSDSVTSSPDFAAVSATSDPSVSSVTVSGPLSVAGELSFNLTVNANFGNSGPDRAIVDATVTLTYPSDCWPKSNPLTSTAVNVPVGGSPMPPRSFRVTCSEPSNHTFHAAVHLYTSNPHVYDAGGENNSGSSATPATVAIEVYADLGVWVAAGAPASIASGTTFEVTADATIVNFGPRAIGADVAVTLGLPPDCFTTSPNPQIDIHLWFWFNVSTYTEGYTYLPTKSWSVTCTEVSSHTFSVSTTIGPGNVHLFPSEPSGSGSVTTVVTGEADTEVLGVSVNAPSAAVTNAPFTVEVDSSVRNNGSYGPASSDVTVGLAVPAGCSSSPPGSQDYNDLLLATSTAVTLPAMTWAVTCTETLTTVFSAAAAIAVDTLDVSDPQPANNMLSADGTYQTHIVLPGLDDDNDGVTDADESACGGETPSLLRPERVDIAGDDDGDTQIDEPLPPGSGAFDCDGDGWSGDHEALILGAGTAGDQDPCGSNGWPADLVGTNNTLNIGDFNSFVNPLRPDGSFNKFDHPIPDPDDLTIARWDLLPDSVISVGDINALNPAVVASTARPPMFGGLPAFFANAGSGTGVCPWPA